MKSYSCPRSRNDDNFINDVEVKEKEKALQFKLIKWKTILITESYGLERTYHNQS